MRRWFRNRSEKRLDHELRFHFEEQVAEYVAAGLSPDEARRKARIEFGHLDEVKEECRDVRPLACVDGLRRDVRFAVRMFARSPGFTAVCLITLALGIGANGAVFSVMNELILKPPPFAEPDGLILVDETTESRDHWLSLGGLNYLPIYPLRKTFQAIDDVAVLGNIGLELQEGDDPESLEAAWASGNLMDVLGTTPAQGRWFTPEEYRSLAPVMVLSHRLWSRRFHEDPSVIGQSIRIGHMRGPRVFQVVGVLPASLDTAFPLAKYEVFIPYDTSGLDKAHNSAAFTIARLAREGTVEAATEELIARQATLYPEKNHTNGGRILVVRDLAAEEIVNIRSGLMLLVAAVGCVLLIACANLAGLFLTRGAERKHEMAIRTGLGAARRAILMQTMVETLLLTGGGAVLALFVAWTGVRGLQSIRFRGLPDISQVGVDWVLIFYCLAVAVAAALLIGALPAWAASRTGTFETLRQQVTGGRSGERRARDLLIVAQVALSVILVVGAGLLVHSMGRLLKVSRGYDPTNVVGFSIRIQGREEGANLWPRLLERAQALPGVASAATVDYGPVYNVGVLEPYRLHGVAAKGEPPAYVNSRAVSQDYFRVLGMPIVAGRGFERPFDEDGREVVVSRAFAEQMWPGQYAVGQRFFIKHTPFEVTVVGVVEDVRNRSFTFKPEPMIYRQTFTSAWGEMLVRTEGEPSSLIDSIKAGLREVDPTQTFREVNTVYDREDAQNAELRFYMYLLSAFAGLALLLAVVGLYSVAAQAAVRRTQEIGLRMAVGASRSQILVMIARQGLVLAAAGITIGMAAAYALGKYLESWLYEITPTDPLTFGAAALLLAAVAWFATFIPARRAARLDPMKALRYE